MGKERLIFTFSFDYHSSMPMLAYVDIWIKTLIILDRGIFSHGAVGASNNSMLTI